MTRFTVKEVDVRHGDGSAGNIQIEIWDNKFNRPFDYFLHILAYKSKLQEHCDRLNAQNWAKI